MDQPDCFEQIVKNWFNEAMIIYALCDDLRLRESDARLLTYIHAKASGSSSGITLFETDCRSTVVAIASLLGRRIGIKRRSLTSHDMLEESIRELAGKDLSALERRLHDEHGIETAFRPELERRLQFHTDSVFRKRMLKLYTLCVLPNIARYTPQDVADSNHRQQVRLRSINRVCEQAVEALQS